MNLYIDTNIIIDFLENRSDRFRPLGEYAHQIFRRGIGCEFFIVLSDHTINELKTVGVPEKEIMSFRALISKKEVFVALEKEDVDCAKKILRKHKTHFKDALHYALMSRYADLLLTNDNELKELPSTRGYEDI